MNDHPRDRTSFGARLVRSEDGSLVVIVMMFAMVFLAIGLALFFLVKSSILGTDLESKGVKSFNVAEAGVDYGMLDLKTKWPSTSADAQTTTKVSAVTTALRADFDATKFRNPTRSPAADFIKVLYYDNTGLANPPTWDSNGDGLMYVASEANVDDSRHRIIILAERQAWYLTFPLIAMYTSSFDANGQGLNIDIDPLQTAPLPLNGTSVPAFYNSQVGAKGLDLGPNVVANPSAAGTFDSWVASGLMGSLKGIAQSEGTYFTTAAPAATLLFSGNAGGKIIYLESPTSVVDISGNTQIGSRENPVVLVIDAGTQTVGLDLKGTGDFYGIIVIKGDAMIRGTASIYGSVIVSGTIINKGTGASPEINYNGNIMKQINSAYTIGVSIVPNTWEEYTTAK
ncbi:MAG: hypothetical protein KKA32_07880 [Actinobacteria bacterium]|nr:hypothetical protein [Actinomycetota bacterium]